MHLSFGNKASLGRVWWLTYARACPFCYAAVSSLVTLAESPDSSSASSTTQPNCMHGKKRHHREQGDTRYISSSSSMSSSFVCLLLLFVYASAALGLLSKSAPGQLPEGAA